MPAGPASGAAYCYIQTKQKLCRLQNYASKEAELYQHLVPSYCQLLVTSGRPAKTRQIFPCIRRAGFLTDGMHIRLPVSSGILYVSYPITVTSSYRSFTCFPFHRHYGRHPTFLFSLRSSALLPPAAALRGKTPSFTIAPFLRECNLQLHFYPCNIVPFSPYSAVPLSPQNLISQTEPHTSLSEASFHAFCLFRHTGDMFCRSGAAFFRLLTPLCLPRLRERSPGAVPA